MAQSLNSWHVSQDARDDEAADILLRDPIWNSFALADLEHPLRNYSQFPMAWLEGSSERAICLILRHPIIGEVISPSGSEEGIAAILKQIDLPDPPLPQVQERHFPCLHHYHRPQTTRRSMFRMPIPPASQQALIQTS